MLEWMQALLTPTVAGFAVYVAWRQHRTAQEKLRLDLFEKRWAVYVALRDFLSVVLRRATIDIEDLRAFTLGAAQAQFLFGQGINDYLAEVKRQANELRTTNIFLDGKLPAGMTRESVAERNAAHLQWLVDQVDGGGAANRFAPYLGFGEPRPRPWWRRA